MEKEDNYLWGRASTGTRTNEVQLRVVEKIDWRTDAFQLFSPRMETNRTQTNQSGEKRACFSVFKSRLPQYGISHSQCFSSQNNVHSEVENTFICCVFKRTFVHVLCSQSSVEVICIWSPENKFSLHWLLNFVRIMLHSWRKVWPFLSCLVSPCGKHKRRNKKKTKQTNIVFNSRSPYLNTISKLMSAFLHAISFRAVCQEFSDKTERASLLLRNHSTWQ